MALATPLPASNLALPLPGRGRSRHGCQWSSSQSASRSRPDKARAPASLMCAQVVRESFRESLVLRWTRKLVANREIRAPVGDHAFDAGAVLGVVHGSPLRFDRARARPSGLDAASAQLLNWLLRDGLHWD